MDRIYLLQTKENLEWIEKSVKQKFPEAKFVQISNKIVEDIIKELDYTNGIEIVPIEKFIKTESTKNESQLREKYEKKLRNIKILIRLEMFCLIAGIKNFDENLEGKMKEIYDKAFNEVSENSEIDIVEYEPIKKHIPRLSKRWSEESFDKIVENIKTSLFSN